MEPGFYPDMTRDEYDEELCLNQSTIKAACEKSMMHAYMKLVNPTAPTPAMIIGKAMHSYILEPDTFYDLFAEMPVTDGNAKVSRASAKGATVWDEWEDEHRGKHAIKKTDIHVLIAMRESVMRNKEAREMIENALAVEASFFWEHPEFHFECKGQLDLLTESHGWTTVVDLKSCEDASPAGFEKAVANMSYMIQHPWYLDGLNEISNAEREFRFIAIEKSYPYPCAVYQLDPLNVFEGRHRCDRISRLWDRALDTQEWEGYPGGSNIVRAKRWAMTHENEEVPEYGDEELEEGAGGGSDIDSDD